MQVFLWPDLSCEFEYGTIDHDAFASVRIEHVLLEAARNQMSAEDISKPRASRCFILQDSAV